MARIIGKDRGYLIGNERRYRNLALFAVALCFIVAGVSFSYSGKKMPAMLMIVFVLLLVYVRKTTDKHIEKFGNFRQGRHGEEVVLEELKKLPDEYSVFHDAHLPGRRGNIDFIVVAPSGIFVLEVKSQRGKIGFDGHRLTRNGSPFVGRSFLKQAMDAAQNVRGYLEGLTGKRYFVTPAVVFSHSTPHFGLEKMKGVTVIGKAYLGRLLSGTAVLGADEREKISTILHTLVVED